MGTPLEPRDEQVGEVLDRLYEEYPDSTISLHYSNRLELLIAVILSAQCTDERVNEVCAELFETYGTPEEYANAPQEEMAEAINSITYYNNKAEYIRSACADIAEKHDGEVPDTMSELTDLAGVGRKTANVVLQHGHDVVEGIVVDTHVQRLTRRLGITGDRGRPEIRSRRRGTRFRVYPLRGRIRKWGGALCPRRQPTSSAGSSAGSRCWGRRTRCRRCSSSRSGRSSAG